MQAFGSSQGPIQHRRSHAHRSNKPFNVPHRAGASLRLKSGMAPDSALGGGATLSSEFYSFLLRQGVNTGVQTGPSPLLPPHVVIGTQLAALQRNNYPDTDTGIKTAFSFAMPYEYHSPSEGVVNKTGLARSWLASESWLTSEQFAKELRSAPFNVMLGCDSWKPASKVVFTSSRAPDRAVHVVHVNSATTPDSASRQFTFSFCLKRVEAGPAKGIWYVVGVRVGDYSG